MKQLIYKLIFPFTVISFATVTKWWYAFPVDAPDTLFTGFPLPFECEGWHTSLSLQIFILEFILDFSVYFLLWFIMIYLIDRFCLTIKIPKPLSFVLWTVTTLVILMAGLIASNSNNIFYLSRPFDMEVLETGYKFNFQVIERPDDDKYYPQTKNKSVLN